MQRVQENSFTRSSLLACVHSHDIWKYLRHVIFDTLGPVANLGSSGKQTGSACVVKCPSPLPPCSKNVNLAPRNPETCRLFSICRQKQSEICFQSVGKNNQKHLIVLCFLAGVECFSPFVTTCWIWYNFILVVFRRLGVRLFGLLRNQDPAKDQEWADKIRSSMQKFRLVLDKEGSFCIGNAVSLADVHCGPFLYRLSAARKHLVLMLLALGCFCAVLTRYFKKQLY